MAALGHSRYFAQGGDIGSGVSMWLARLYPDAVRALHLNFVSGSFQPPLTEADRPLSPAGLAAWLLEKCFTWSDGSGGLIEKFDLDDLLTNVAVYWFSGNVAATLRIYRKNARQPLRFGAGERIAPPLSYARFPKEILSPPREWVARVFNVTRWTEMPVGGHFAALEQPLALANDIHEALSVFR
jgi:pimeloyl-ACP methyl ester carboxylesterase